MSTRATYEIDNQTFYIHHDGYPSHAAIYFLNAIKQDDDGFAESFIRSNEKAIFCKSHEAHGDTEFRYTYDTEKDQLYVSALNWDKDVFEDTFNGKLGDFINEHIEHFHGQEKPEKVLYGLMTERKALKYAMHDAGYVLQHGKQGKWTGNLSSSIDTLRDKICTLGSYVDGDKYESITNSLIIAGRELRKNFQETNEEIKAENVRCFWEHSEVPIDNLKLILSILDKEQELSKLESEAA